MAESEPDHKHGEGSSSPYGTTQGDHVAAGANDDAIFSAGVLDPVYDAKARVLNRAVRLPSLSPRISVYIQVLTMCFSDCRPWHGLVPVAALHRRRLWMGI